MKVGGPEEACVCFPEGVPTLMDYGRSLACNIERRGGNRNATLDDIRSTWTDLIGLLGKITPEPRDGVLGMCLALETKGLVEPRPLH